MYFRKRKDFVIVSAKHLRVLAFAGLFLAVCFFVNVRGVYAATFVVNSTADVNDATPGDGVCETATGNGVCTLRAAITEANALAGDDIITLPAGTYTITLGFTNTDENANAEGDFDISSNITINGAGSGSTIIQAATTSGTAVQRVLHFRVANTTAIINDVTIRNGRTDTFSGGGIRVQANGTNVTFNDSIIRDNFTVLNGGGIFLQNSSATTTLNNTVVTNNMAEGDNGTTRGGGIYLEQNTTLNVNNSTISNNTARATGASNLATGGGINTIGGTVNVTNSTVTNNLVTTTGTGQAFGGGLMVQNNATMNVTGSTISVNTASSTGGGTGLTGGINNEQATLNITTSTVSGNIADFQGGVRTLGATLPATTTITQSAIINNNVNGDGGGVTNLTVGANAVTNIINSTVGENQANNDAGGIFNINASDTGTATVNVNYSTIANNTANADNAGSNVGGGIYNRIVLGVGVVNLYSSIVGNNTVGTGGAGPDIFGTITSQDYNHVEDISGGVFIPQTNDVTKSDPGISMTLAFNGGQTQNYIPLVGSPVIDTIPSGTNGCGIALYNVDQRGFARPTDSDLNGVPACEKGSVEKLFPTAAAVSISGRVLYSSDSASTTKNKRNNQKSIRTSVNIQRGIPNAIVHITDQDGNISTARTNMFGYFKFEDVEAGQTLIVNVYHRSYHFSPQVVIVNDAISNLNFTPQ